ncbi:hypothetical protein SLE2022_096770 [Rubroshorea leprosula]|uniref:LOB domain-containing protein n=1 Tax=Rubroshorea leprosula TaxID=152421 RepID=A0AAV5M2P5_9ROSI|nr:hypothetical protein SLEP1_g51210 [Rubroshorea leprosula]
MKMSCNGCRILRKGCSDNCIIRPCLLWIKSPESQANATLFLAKFYGRAGLTNLIEAGAPHLRPAIFRSLLYEACGRVVNPVLGSAGLLFSGNWNHCEAAVDAVLRGLPITPIMQTPVSNSSAPVTPQKSYDIRHVSKDSVSAEISKVKTSTPFKRSIPNPKSLVPSTSRIHAGSDNKEDGSLLSAISMDDPLLNQKKPQPGGVNFDSQAEAGKAVLDLTLALALPSRSVN